MKEWVSNLGAVTIILLMLLCIVGLAFFPFAIIWALNTLFKLNIAFGLFEYLAVVVLNISALARAVK